MLDSHLIAHKPQPVNNLLYFRKKPEIIRIHYYLLFKMLGSPQSSAGFAGLRSAMEALPKATTLGKTPQFIADVVLDTCG